MDKRLKEIHDLIENGEMKILKKEDSFHFSCEGCGHCCINKDDIIINTHDIFRLRKLLEETGSEIINNYCKVHLGPDSGFPIITLAMKTIQINNSTYRICPFLTNINEKMECVVSSHKPTVCAMFPLGRMISMKSNTKEEEINYFLQDITCNAKKNNKYTVKEWLSIYNLDESEEFFILFSDFLSNITLKYDLSKFFNNEEIGYMAKDSLFNLMIHLLYLNYDLKENFINQFKTNIEKLSKYLDEIDLELKLSNINILR